MKKYIVLASALAMSCAVGGASAMALLDWKEVEARKAKANPNPPAVVRAPEIDAAAGVQAIALLSGVLLLVGERKRRNREAQG